MSQTKNERGYALITTLLIITVFIIIFISFTGLAFSNVKQNQIVEESTQSIDLAEMGVSYYQIALQNRFEYAKQGVEGRILNGEVITRDQLLNELKQSSLNELNTLSNQPISIDDDAHFTLLDTGIQAEVINNRIEVKYSVIGNKNGVTSQLDTELVIDTDFEFESNRETPNQQQLPESFLINWPEIDEVNCHNPSSLEDITVIGGKVTCLIDEPVNRTKIYETTGKDFSAKIIYSKVNLVLADIKKADTLEIYAKSLQINDNSIHPSELVIKTEENITFDHNAKKLTNVYLYVGGRIEAKKHFEVQNSKVFILGNSSNDVSSFSQKLDIDQSSIMCVNGDISLENENQFNVEGELYIKGNINDDQKKYSNVTYVTLENQEQYNDRCKGIFDVPSINTVDWGNTSNTIITNVTYN